MTNTFYDDFKAMTAERMAGSMEDMTYACEQTRVPKAHYRKMLSTVADHIEQAIEFRPVRLRAGRMVGEHPFAAGLGERVGLQRLVLLQSGHPGTAHDHGQAACNR